VKRNFLSSGGGLRTVGTDSASFLDHGDHKLAVTITICKLDFHQPRINPDEPYNGEDYSRTREFLDSATRLPRMNSIASAKDAFGRTDSQRTEGAAA